MAKKSLDAPSFEHIAILSISTVLRSEGERWHRIHRSAFEPLWFGPGPEQLPSGRFDAPAHEYRACYFGLSPEAAFAETLLRNPSNRILSRIDLEARSISAILLTREVLLAQLHGTGLRRLGLSTDTVHGSYARCRDLALALWSHRRGVDGIEYRSRFDNDENCFVLFDRARDAVEIETTEGLMDDQHLLGRLLDAYDVGFAP